MSSYRTREANVNIVRPMLPPEKVEIFKSMEHWVRSNIVTLLKRLRNLGNHKTFCQIPPQMDSLSKSMNSGREQRTFPATTLLP
ncbi:hypothetical protein SLA2020_272180 [Shorea laevis]